ncbi:MAG: hypothetical protein BWY09_02592 [Candidatus Hydrogenedentes bacterium ADurb.Bin179]|nr:MAG: hypothetical protein BWY09_02592 [Candidatus Hydrogenedentes bacterium ADurb.Bin179]
MRDFTKGFWVSIRLQCQRAHPSSTSARRNSQSTHEPEKNSSRPILFMGDCLRQRFFRFFQPKPDAHILRFFTRRFR